MYDEFRSQEKFRDNIRDTEHPQKYFQPFNQNKNIFNFFMQINKLFIKIIKI